MEGPAPRAANSTVWKDKPGACLQPSELILQECQCAWKQLNQILLWKEGNAQITYLKNINAFWKNTANPG